MTDLNYLTNNVKLLYFYILDTKKQPNDLVNRPKPFRQSIT